MRKAAVALLGLALLMGVVAGLLWNHPDLGRLSQLAGIGSFLLTGASVLLGAVGGGGGGGGNRNYRVHSRAKRDSTVIIGENVTVSDNRPRT